MACPVSRMNFIFTPQSQCFILEVRTPDLDPAKQQQYAMTAKRRMMKRIIPRTIIAESIEITKIFRQCRHTRGVTIDIRVTSKYYIKVDFFFSKY